MADSPAAPATFGGPGWSVRDASHREDVAAGALWHRCGLDSEVAPLREVMLSWPSEAFDTPGDPDAALMLAWPDAEALRAQALGVAAFYESHGVAVRWLRAPAPPLNTLFMADLLWMTPEGVVVARPASPVRAPEARLAARALAELGVPILSTVHGQATFEGADACWLDRRTVLVGVGARTSPEGWEALRRLLEPMGVEVLRAEVPAGVQHLMGVLRLVDHDLALLDAARAPDSLRALLRARGVALIEVPPGDEVRARMALNGVVLGPRRFAAPAGCPRTREVLEAAGVAVFPVEVGEYTKAAGGLGCLTGVLRRDPGTQ